MARDARVGGKTGTGSMGREISKGGALAQFVEVKAEYRHYGVGGYRKLRRQR